jgi:hypothetical protein
MAILNASFRVSIKIVIPMNHCTFATGFPSTFHHLLVASRTMFRADLYGNEFGESIEVLQLV